MDVAKIFLKGVLGTLIGAGAGILIGLAHGQYLARQDSSNGLGAFGAVVIDTLLASAVGGTLGVRLGYRKATEQLRRDRVALAGLDSNRQTSGTKKTNGHMENNSPATH